MKFSIPLFELSYDELEEQAVKEVLRSGWISMGPKTEALEFEFAKRIGTRHAIALSSGTAALHLAVSQVAGPGDEVIVPSLTFVATPNAVRYCGAKTVFADICGPDDFSLDPAYVSSKITPRTKAIVVVHYAGFSCDMSKFSDLADRHGLALIEDCAHSPASDHNGRKLGSIGNAGCFSFFSNKNMTCAEGGMLTTNDDKFARKVKLMRSHGMTAVSHDRAKKGTSSYDVLNLGYNYRIDDIRAALALTQLGKLDADRRKREKIWHHYANRVEAIDGISIPYKCHTHQSSYHIMPVILQEGGSNRREKVRHYLADQGIQTSIHYPAAHTLGTFSNSAIQHKLPWSEHIASHEITLPFWGSMKEQTVDRCLETVSAALNTI